VVAVRDATDEEVAARTVGDTPVTLLATPNAGGSGKPTLH